MQAIADKLQRFVTLRLPQMADIAGCRIIVNSLGSIAEVQGWIQSTIDVVDSDDYIDHPKAIGYRALHIVVEIPESNHSMSHDARSTMVEIQVRTPRQNQWADQIERSTGSTGFDLKSGNADDLPEELVEYVRVASDIRYLADADRPADTSLERRLARLRESVRKYF